MDKKTSNRVYGYARVSTPKQNIDRQVENIQAECQQAVVIREEYTGTTTDRPQWNKLYERLKKGDTVIFDEVSRMSRNAQEGIDLYTDLFDKGIHLKFIKEPHINSSVYKDAMQARIDKIGNTGSKATDKLLNSIMDALHEYTIDLAREQIELAFKTAQTEVDLLHKRTRDGIERARKKGKQIGQRQGAILNVKKKVPSMEKIKKYSKDFDGSLNDVEVLKMFVDKNGKSTLSRNSYYKYKRELRENKEI